MYAQRIFVSCCNISYNIFLFQLKELKDKLPPEVSESEAFESINSQAEAYLNANEALETSLLTTSGQEQETYQKTEEQVSSKSSITEASNSSRPPITEASSSRTSGKESKEQFEPGVYVTYEVDMNGNKIFRRVRFSKKRFDEHQAEDWWTKNKDRLLKSYGSNSSSSSSSNPTASDSPIASQPPSDPSVPEQSNEKEPDSET